MHDGFIPLLGSSGEPGIAVGGGADYGEFPFVTSALGGGLTVGDIVLEIGGTPVLGMTLGDVRGVLNSCPHPIRIKTVSPGKRKHVHLCSSFPPTYRWFLRPRMKISLMLRRRAPLASIQITPIMTHKSRPPSKNNDKKTTHARSCFACKGSRWCDSQCRLSRRWCKLHAHLKEIW